MTSKKALKNIKTLSYCKQHITIQEWCNLIEQDLDRLEQLEDNIKICKETIKMQHNQIEKLESELKRKSGIICMLESENESLHTKIKSVSDETEEQFKKFLDKENEKQKKVIEILKEKLDIKIEFNHNVGYSLNHKVIHNCITSNERCIRHLEVEEADLLKEYFK